MKPAATNRRIALLAGTFLVLLAATLARAAWIQVVKGPEYAAMALRQHRETVIVPASRGTIVDRNGEPLAIGKLATTVYANPRQVDDARDLTLAAGKQLGIDPAVLYPTLVDRSRGFVYVARKADPRKAKNLEALNFAGLGFYPEELRYYPQGPVAAQVLGYAGLDNKGLEGLERSLEGTLAGKPGSQTIVKDPFGRALDVVETKPESPGRSVRLTIDREIQANAEEVLQDTVRRWGARAATAVVMDPRTGEVLAMATAPRFNANRFPTTRADRRRNRAVTDTYEPGSTFKLVTIAAALQDKIVNPRSVLPARSHDPGRRPRDPRRAHARNGTADREADRRVLLEHRDDHDRRAPRCRQARVVDRPLRVRSEDRHRLPGRVGRVRASARPVVWIHDRNGSDRARHRRHAGADGTCVLGDRERRHARAAAHDRSHRRQDDRARGTGAASSRAASSEQMLGMLRGVVLEGTGTEAAIPGYTVAGKTGTAAKIDPDGTYSTSRYVASFVGMVPATKPKLVIMVMVDEPHGDIYGGVVAAPAFREIARFNLQHLEIPQDDPSRRPGTR